MDEQKLPPNPEEPIRPFTPTAGQTFVKGLRPLGCVLFLALSIFVTVLCFLMNRDPIPGYEAPQDTAYYAVHLDALAEELEQNVFPLLDYDDLTAAVTDPTVTVTAAEEDLLNARAALIRYFDQNLLTFEAR